MWALAAVGLFACEPVEAQKWVVFTSPDNDFAVSVPGEMKFVPEKGNPPGGIPRTRFRLDTDDSYGVVFTVSRLDFPTKSISLKPDLALDSVRDTSVATTHGTLSKETSITLGGRPGREILILGPEDTRLTQRMYIAGDKLYVVFAVAPKAGSLESVVSRFLNSFEIK